MYNNKFIFVQNPEFLVGKSPTERTISLNLRYAYCKGLIPCLSVDLFQIHVNDFYKSGNSLSLESLCSGFDLGCHIEVWQYFLSVRAIS